VARAIPAGTSLAHPGPAGDLVKLLDLSAPDVPVEPGGRALANTFPSGRVAATTAASPVVLEHGPILGAVFLWVSAGIAVSVVIRRYHFLTDAVLAVAMVLVVGWTVWR